MTQKVSFKAKITNFLYFYVIADATMYINSNFAYISPIKVWKPTSKVKYFSKISACCLACRQSCLEPFYSLIGTTQFIFWFFQAVISEDKNILLPFWSSWFIFYCWFVHWKNNGCAKETRWHSYNIWIRCLSCWWLDVPIQVFNF